MKDMYSIGNNGMFTNYVMINLDWVEAFGFNEGAFLSILHTWLLSKANHKIDFINGRYWVYNTYEGWLKAMPWIKKTTLASVIGNLKKLGVLICEDFNKSGLKIPKWYTIDYDMLDEYMRIHTMKKNGAVINVTTIISTGCGQESENTAKSDVQILNYDVQNPNHVVQSSNIDVQKSDYEVRNLNGNSPKIEIPNSEFRTNNTPKTIDNTNFDRSSIINSTITRTNIQAITHTITQEKNNNNCNWVFSDIRSVETWSETIRLLQQRDKISCYLSYKVANRFLMEGRIFELYEMILSQEWTRCIFKEEKIKELLGLDVTCKV